MIEINLRECPFCGGNTAHYVGEAGSMNVKCQWCDAEHNSAADWNTRPIEDALLKRAEAAEKRVFELEQAMNDLLDVVNQWRKKKAKELE